MSCERFEPLVSAWIDGELAGAERAALLDHLEGCASCRRVRDELAALSRSTREGLEPPPPPPGVWDSMGARVAARLSRRSGWWLLVPGVILLAGYAGFVFAIDDTVDALVKVGVAGAVVGLSLLFVSVLIDRLRDRRHERYEEVER